jgi:hypothetical protein
MSITVDEAFVKQYEAEVKLAYQQMGSKLRSTVRLKTGVIGSTVDFRKVGKGTASQKSRHGKVPVMNAVHSYVTATLEDWFAGDWVDKLDEIKTNIEERQITVQTGAYALGRKVDSQIIAAARLSLDSGQVITHDGAITSYLNTVLNKEFILRAFKLLNDKDVPDDGNRFCVLGPYQWNRLLKIEEVGSSDYVGMEKHPWLGGTQAIKWLNTTFLLHTDLPTVNSAASRCCLMFHKSAIGLAEGQGVTADITWHGDYNSHFVNNFMSGGAIRIDSEGVVEMRVQES